MPHTNKDNILVVTKDEVLAARDENGRPFFKDWNHLKVTLYRYADKTFGMKRAEHGGGKGRTVTIVFDSLPAEMQEAIGDPRKAAHPLLEFFEIDRKAVEFYNAFRTRSGELDNGRKQEYITSASLLNAALALTEARRSLWRSMGKTTARGLEASVCEDLKSFAPILKRRWHRTYNLPENMIRLREKMRGYAGLEGDDRYLFLINGQTGNRHASVKTDAQTAILESLFMNQRHKPTPTEVARQYEGFLDGYVEIISSETGEIYNPKDFGKLSQRTITAYLTSWHSSIATYSKRAGNRQKFLNDFMPYAELLKPEWAGSIISVDDRNPPFWYAKGKRVWFYCAYDIGAQCFTAWVYGKTKEGIISDFYRSILRNYTAWGIPLPAEIECESSLNSLFRDTMLADGAMFRYVRMEANKARGKYIERVWEKLRYGTEKTREGWLARPNAIRESNQKSDENLPIVPYDEIVRNCLTDIQNWNNSLHPDQERFPGMTRWEVFTERQNPELSMKTNWKMILPYIGYRTATSCKAGVIKLQRKEYFLGLDGRISRGGELVSLLETVEGHEVDVYWLDGNDGEIMKAIVCMKDTEKIVCEAIRKPAFHRAKIEQTAADRENMETVMAYVNTFQSFISRRKAEIEKVTVIDRRTETVSGKFVIPELEKPAVHREEEAEELLIDDDPDMAAAYQDAEVLDGSVRTGFKPASENIRKGRKSSLLKQLTGMI